MKRVPQFQRGTTPPVRPSREVSRLLLSTITIFRLTAERRASKLLLTVPDNALADKLNAVIN